MPQAEEDLDQLVLEKERALASTSRKEDVAKRPASYKSSLSLQLPVGTTRSQKDRRRDGANGSPERRQHVYVENKGAYKPEESNNSKSSDNGVNQEKMKIL